MEAAIVDDRELIGVAEIAALAEVRQSAVSNWAARWDREAVAERAAKAEANKVGMREVRTFPEPVARTRMGPVYDKAEIMAWLIATGRYKV